MFHSKILIADDHIIFSEGLRSLLEDKFEIVGTVSDGRALVEAARTLTPDVIVADISMPLLNGLAAVRQLRREGNHTRVIFLTMHAEAQIVIEAFRTGAIGYVLKQSAGDELITAIRASLEGQNYVTHLVTQEVEQSLFGAAHGDHKPEILQMLAEGQSPTEIGSALNVPTAEVEMHRDEMMRDLGSRTTEELVRLASQLGLVTTHHPVHC